MENEEIMKKVYGSLSIILVFLISLSGCISDTNEETIKVHIKIESVNNDLIINYNLYYKLEDPEFEELINFNHTFTKGMGQQTSFDVPKRDYSWYFTFKILNLSNPESIIQFEEIVVDNPYDPYTFYIYDVGLHTNITIEHWEGGGVA
jgi:hypothetical protein